jgi:hypothetical protein
MADYPISNVPRRVQYVNSGVGPYAFTFEILVQTDIAVYRGSTLLTLTTDYTVAINANGTGSITLVVAGTGNITIVGARAIQRSSDYTTGGDLFASTLNTDLDSQTIYSQQLAESLDSTIKVPVTDASTLNLELPNAASRANKVFAFDAVGAPQVSTNTLAAIDSAVNTITSIAGAPSGSSAGISHIATGSGAVTTTVQAKLRETVSVKDFGAVGDGIVDDTLAIQAAIDSIERGVLLFPAGIYRTTATINILYKNDQNDSTQSNLEISAFGAKIVSSVTGATPALYIEGCKRLTILGLEISAASTTLTVQVQGLWNSSFDDCIFGNIEFTGLGAVFDSHYNNKFSRCFFNTVTLKTGTNAARSEFNLNIFDSCKIWFGEYAIKKYGSHGVESVTFINCDISYQTVAILYVDEPTSGNLTFVSAYFDSAPGFPYDTKGILLNFMGSIMNPNSANTESFLVGTASGSESKGDLGVRIGNRIPTSGYNLIRNGDLRAGTSSVTSSNTATTVVSGTGLFGQYLNTTTSTAFGLIEFSSLPVPVTGYYTLTVIGKASNTGNVSTQCNGVFGVIELSTDWTISSFTTYINQGSSVAFRMTNGTGATMNADFAYVGLTYGRFAPIYAPIHPSADFYSPGTVQGGFTNLALTSSTMAGIRREVFTKTYTPSLSATNILAISSSGHTTFEVDVFYVDINSPNGTFLQKLYIATRGSGNNVINIDIVQENKVKSLTASATDYLTWTASVVSNQVMLIATASGTTGGDGSILMQVTGNINGATVQ